MRRSPYPNSPSCQVGRHSSQGHAGVSQRAMRENNRFAPTESWLAILYSPEAMQPWWRRCQKEHHKGINATNGVEEKL